MSLRQEHASGIRVRDLLGLAGFAIAVLIAAVLGGLAAAGASEDYAALEQPAWAPPDWVFTPVWTVLYVAIAVAGWLVWRQQGFARPLVPYAIQLILNAAWTPLFFAANSYGWAAIEIAALWIAIGVTVVVFWRVHRLASLLLIPYWAWVTFAGALNVAIWWLNR